jgi:hypothetical protein
VRFEVGLRPTPVSARNFISIFFCQFLPSRFALRKDFSPTLTVRGLRIAQSRHKSVQLFPAVQELDRLLGFRRQGGGGKSAADGPTEFRKLLVRFF